MMQIQQFEYKPLSHFSYAILSGNEIALVDPERDPSAYYAFAKANNSKITAIFETHPHADFISAHLQIHKETGATIYASKMVGADYPHTPFDDGDSLVMGAVIFTALNTPGHSPDSITIMAKTEDKTVIFTGDTLFIGDVGRPDLREKTGNKKAKRIDLAKQMYHSIATKFTDLPDDALVYPAHGAGSLCGKSMSDAASSTLGNERLGNWAFKTQTEQEFVDVILDGQPFVPHYFGHAVDRNKMGALALQESIRSISINESVSVWDGRLIIDTRAGADFKKGHFPHSFNIMAVSELAKFETWLGSIVPPKETFAVVVTDAGVANKILERIAKIGYESQVELVMTLAKGAGEPSRTLDLDHFKHHKGQYTIVDIRNASETAEGGFFQNALTIPLHELRERTQEIPTGKPIVIHCAGGYRSAAGSSIVADALPGEKVYDLGEAVKQFQ